MNTIRMSNSLYPNQAQHFVGPDLDLNCSQRFAADDDIRQRVKASVKKYLFRGSYMSAHVLLNLIKQVEEK